MSNGAGSRLGVVVSGGAPTLHLAAGALCAFYKQGIQFDVVATSGAGALPGLLYLVPKDVTPDVALERVKNMNVSDAIYDLIPSNFKVFFKYGWFSSIFYRFGQMIPHFPPDELPSSPFKRLANDWIDFVTAAITPTTLNYWSKSVLNRVQVINDLVDWSKLARLPENRHFFLNAFNLDDSLLRVFTKETMSPDAFYAALAMPWLYPPTSATKATTPLFTEGASHDPSGIEAVLENQQPSIQKVDAFIVLDTIASDLWNDPESLYEALELTIMDPIVTLSENVAALYALQEYVLNRVSGSEYPRIYRLPLEIPQWQLGKVLEWSYSNGVLLWDVGYKAAMKFGESMKKFNLVPEQNRYFDTLDEESREGDFLKLFGNPFSALGKVVVPPPVRSRPGGGA